MNQKLDEALIAANHKLSQYENGTYESKFALNAESTNIGDNTNTTNMKYMAQHRRKISFDPKFLANASPE